MFGKKKYYPWVYLKQNNMNYIYKNMKNVPYNVFSIRNLKGFFVTRRNLVSEIEGEKFSFNDLRGIAKKFKGKFIPFE